MQKQWSCGFYFLIFVSLYITTNAFVRITEPSADEGIISLFFIYHHLDQFSSRRTVDLIVIVCKTYSFCSRVKGTIYKLVLVVNVYVFLGLLLFIHVLDLVYDVEAIFHLP